MMIRGLTRLVTGKANEGEIGGPVRIAEFSADAARQGIFGFDFYGVNFDKSWSCKFNSYTSS